MRSRLLALIVLALPGCGGPSQPARFAGRADDARTAAADVVEVSARPPGYRLLGRVVSRCRDERHEEALRGEWLHDVACSEALLVAALREKVAEVGGDVLVARRCREEPTDAGRIVTCNGRVGRAKDEPAERAGAAAHGEEPPPPSPVEASDRPASDQPWLAAPSDAWRVSVTFTPEPKARLGEPRHLDEVREAPDQPVSQIVVGSVVTACDGTCDPSVVREAVRATAARVGADSVFGVRCVRVSQGLLCSGHAGAYEFDPRQVAEAR